MLLKRGADVDSNDGYDCALSKAGRSPKSNALIVKLLLENGANIKGSPIGKGINPLIRAAHQSDSERIRLLIDYGSDLNMIQSKPLNLGLSPFQELLSWAPLQLLQYAVTKGADIRKVTSKNDTPLHMAACYGRLDVVVWLLSLGVSKEVLNEKKETPVQAAENHLSQIYFQIHPKCQSTVELQKTISFLKSI